MPSGIEFSRGVAGWLAGHPCGLIFPEVGRVRAPHDAVVRLEDG